jgi:transposase
MTGKRKRYTAEFKAKIALEALRGELTVSQLAAKHGVHQTMISGWKRQAMEGLASVFSGRAEAKDAARQPVGLLLPACGRDGGEPGADAIDRRTVHGDAVVWHTADGATASPSGS